jgi:transposase, IS5 family
MPRRTIGQEMLFQGAPKRSPLDEITGLVDWALIAARLEVIHAAPKGEASWPPLAMFRALLLSVWYDLSDVKLAEALDDRASFRRFCGFGRAEPTPERTAFVRFRRELVCHGLDEALFEDITRQLKAKAVTVKTGTLVDATVVGSASEGDGGQGDDPMTRLSDTQARDPQPRPRSAMTATSCRCPARCAAGPPPRWWARCSAAG